MPTGYTAGIIDGDYKTFPDFAKKCARAFGAMVSMRDEPMKSEWVREKPSDYYKTSLSEATKKLLELKSKPESVVMEEHKASLNESIDRYKKYIEEAIEKKGVLNKFLSDAISYKSPSKEHDGVRDFMIEQIQMTIKQDGNTKYYEDHIKETEVELLELDPRKIYNERIEAAERDIEYYKEQLDADEKRVKERNEWVELYFKSLEEQYGQ